MSHVWSGCDLSVATAKNTTMTCLDVIRCDSCKEGITMSCLDILVQQYYCTYFHFPHLLICCHHVQYYDICNVLTVQFT